MRPTDPTSQAAARVAIERRAELSLGLTGAVGALLLAWQIPAVWDWFEGAEGARRWVLGLAVFGLVVGWAAVTGWWVDAVRAWWVSDQWSYRLRSAVSWALPFVNVIAPGIDAALLLRGASRPRWEQRAWGWIWILSAVGLGVVRLDVDPEGTQVLAVLRAVDLLVAFVPALLAATS